MAYVDYCNVRTGTLEKWKTPDEQWSIIPELTSSSFDVRTTNNAWFYNHPTYYRLSTGIIQIAVSLKKQSEMGMTNEEYERLVKQFQNSEPRMYVIFGIKTEITPKKPKVQNPFSPPQELKVQLPLSLAEAEAQNPEFEFSKEIYKTKDFFFYPICFNRLTPHQLESLIASHQLAKGETKLDPGKVRGCFFVRKMPTPSWVFIYRIYTKATSVTKLALQFSIEFITEPQRRSVTQDERGENTASEFLALSLFNKKILFPPVEILARPYRNTETRVPQIRKRRRNSVAKGEAKDEDNDEDKDEVEVEDENEENEDNEFEPPKKMLKSVPTSSDILLEGLEKIPSSRPIERMLLYQINAKLQEIESQNALLHENYWKMQKEQNNNFMRFSSAFLSITEDLQQQLKIIDSHCDMTEVFFSSLSNGFGRMSEEAIKLRNQILPPPLSGAFPPPVSESFPPPTHEELPMQKEETKPASHTASQAPPEELSSAPFFYNLCECE